MNCGPGSHCSPASTAPLPQHGPGAPSRQPLKPRCELGTQVQVWGPPGQDGEVSVSVPLKASLLDAVALTPAGHDGEGGVTKLNCPVLGFMAPVNVFPEMVTLIDVPL
jgi:hypothetical protein